MIQPIPSIYVHTVNRRSQWSNVIWCQMVGLGALPWTYVLVQPMRETPPLQPRGQKDVNGSNAWLNVPAWPKTSCASQRIVLHWHWRQRIGWKIKMECLKLLILTAACSWDIERDKETKKLRNSHTLAYVMRKQITAAIAHRVNISVRNTQMIHLLICNLIRHEVSGKGKSKLRPKGMWQM